jgi:hypothetical protein
MDPIDRRDFLMMGSAGAGFKIQVNETWRTQTPEALAQAIAQAAR